MWGTIGLVSGGFSLAAFIAAAIVTILRSKWNQEKQLINDAPEASRGQLVQTVLDRFSVDTGRLTKDQTYSLALKLIQARLKRLRILTVGILSGLFLFGATAVAAFFIDKAYPDPPGDRTGTRGGDPVDRQTDNRTHLPSVADRKEEKPGDSTTGKRGRADSPQGSSLSRKELTSLFDGLNEFQSRDRVKSLAERAENTHKELLARSMAKFGADASIASPHQWSHCLDLPAADSRILDLQTKLKSNSVTVKFEVPNDSTEPMCTSTWTNYGIWNGSPAPIARIEVSEKDTCPGAREMYFERNFRQEKRGTDTRVTRDICKHTTKTVRRKIRLWKALFSAPGQDAARLNNDRLAFISAASKLPNEIKLKKPAEAMSWIAKQLDSLK